MSQSSPADPAAASSTAPAQAQTATSEPAPAQDQAQAQTQAQPDARPEAQADAQPEAQAAAAPADPFVTTYGELLALLNHDGVPHQANITTKEVVIPTQKGALDSVLLMRFQDEQGVLQFIQLLTVEVPPERIPAIESALARLNAVLVVAGFELSHETRRLAYRASLPLFPRGGLLSSEIQAYFRMAVKTASDFLPTFARIAEGQAGPDTVVDEAKRDMRTDGTPAAPPPGLSTY